jgi:hypothetical protein
MSVQTQAAIVGHANQVADRWRKRGASHDRVNRYLGRVDAIRALIAARSGDLVPTLYVKETAVPGHVVLTTWTGTFVSGARITGEARGFHGVKLYCYSTVIEGRRYHGRGLGNGMCLNLKPGKRVA